MKGVIASIKSVSSVDFEITIETQASQNISPWQYLKIDLENNIYYFSVLSQWDLFLKLLVRAKEPISEKLNLFLNSLNKEITFEVWWKNYFTDKTNFSDNLLISMGSWISPILNILKVCKENGGVNNIVLHSEKKYDNVPYLETLSEEITLFLTGENSRLRRKDSLKRISTYLEDLEDIKDIEEENLKTRKIKRIFLCGNKDFVSSIKDLLINNFWFNEKDILS